MLIETSGRVQYKELIVYMSEITFQKVITSHSFCAFIQSLDGLKNYENKSLYQ